MSHLLHPASPFLGTSHIAPNPLFSSVQPIMIQDPLSVSGTGDFVAAAANLLILDGAGGMAELQEEEHLLQETLNLTQHLHHRSAGNHSGSNRTYDEEECYEDQSFTVFQYTTDDLLLAASMASTVFNILVIFCALKLYKRSGDTMHLFILNMTFGDLILTVFCHPNELLIRKHAILQKHDLCVVVHFFNWVGLAISGLSLTMLNMDKLIYFRWPLSYDRFMSKRKAIMICAMIWTVTLGFIGYCWIYNVVYIHISDCSLQMTVGKKFFYEIFLVIFCVLPVISSMIVSIYLFKLTRQKRNATLVGGVADQTTFKNKIKSMVFIFATTAWTCFSLLPYRLMNIARIHFFTWSNLTCQERQTLTWVAWCLVYLLTINPIVNPLITSLIYAPYRLTIKRFLVNIPVGNRPLYPYRGDSDSYSVASLRRARTRRGSGGEHELACLRQHDARVSIATEISRSDIPSTPSTPMKRNMDDRRISEDFGSRPKSSVYPTSASQGSLCSNGAL